ncbi:Conserved hypothetical ATP binding protein [Rhizoctonia solani]|uniref:Conserved hypothetical ATP binding protein n=1 Tax=Rhizoctonia solani TaxID=456999 RepID=A0A8H7LF98_9AGAM|nr:Conserved hypothetical ATP binding protein [Rhizoctonia solani]
MSSTEESAAPAAGPSATPKKPITIITIGMAGSGKTTFVQRITSYLRSTASSTTDAPRPPYVINLDPAVANVPFEANIDIRDTVDYKEVMKQYNLGPNGGILTSLNLFTTKFDQVLSLVEKRSSEVDYIVLDTPGQIEIFTWSASGAILTDAMAAAGPACLAYIIDTPRILYKTRLPFIIVFNKTDVTPHEFAVEWMSDFEAFQAALASREHRDADGEPTYMSSLMNSMSLVLDEFYRHLKPVGVSSATGAGVKDFFKAVDEAREEYEKNYKPELEKLKKERDDKLAATKQDSVDRLMKDLAVDKERAQNSNPHWTGRENPYLDKWADAGEDDDDEPVINFRGGSRPRAGISRSRDDGEIDDDENREYDVDEEDDIVDRDDDVDTGMRENLKRASRGQQGGVRWPRPATGEMGIILTRKALEAGHIVTVYVRNPAKLPEDIASHESIIVVKGELTDEDSLRHAIRHTHAILSNLGPGTTPSHFPGAHPSNLPLSKAYSLILRIMKEPEVECKRIILLGTVSIPDPNDKRDLAIWTLVQGIKLTAYDAYADEVAIGETVRREGDGIEWTIVRVPLLTRSENEAVVAGYVGAPKLGTYVSRSGFAAFCLSELSRRQWVLKAPMIASNNLDLPPPNMRTDSLPIEIVALVLPSIPRRSLISSSTVCKVWRSVALPILCRSIRLAYATDDPSWSQFTCFPAMTIKNYLEEFTERVLDETDGASRIPSYARRLRIDMELKQEDVEVFITAISKMKNLDHVAWTVSGMNEVYWYRALERLCLELPNLRSLRLVMAHNKFQMAVLYSVQVHTSHLTKTDLWLVWKCFLLDLTAIWEATISTPDQSSVLTLTNYKERPSWTVPNMIVKLIRNTQNIEFLAIDPEQLPTIVMGPIWGVDNILAELSSQEFPHSSHLRMGVYERPVLTHNFGHHIFGIWRFIQNHKHLQTIELDISEFEEQGGPMISPRDIEEAMPSIRHIRAPVSVVTPLLNSSLGAQLETLDIAYPAHLNHFHIEELSRPSFPELSRLRALRIFTNHEGAYDSNGDSNVIHILGEIAARVPVLKELVILTTGLNGPSQYDQASVLMSNIRDSH